jgi:hypothetical protein
MCFGTACFGRARVTWPVDGPVLRVLLLRPCAPVHGGQHRGVDLGAPSGTDVLAPAEGVVTFAGTVPTGGKTVSIETPFGYTRRSCTSDRSGRARDAPGRGHRRRDRRSERRGRSGGAVCLLRPSGDRRGPGLCRPADVPAGATCGRGAGGPGGGGGRACRDVPRRSRLRRRPSSPRLLRSRLRRRRQSPSHRGQRRAPRRLCRRRASRHRPRRRRRLPAPTPPGFAARSGAAAR